jgi:hypothetical protein
MATTSTSTSTSTVVAIAEPVFTSQERLALAGFLAGYTGLTREAYALDLRQYATWCQQRHVRLFEARRADIECFARDLEARGRARATVTRRLCTIAGLYRYAVEEDLLDHSPAAHVRRPRLDYESHATGLDRNELGAMLVAAGLGPAPEHALTAGGSWQHCAPASKRSPGIPEHPREGRPARQRAETRQARLRPPARITEPPPRTPPRRRQDNQEGTHLKAKRERTG